MTNAKRKMNSVGSASADAIVEFTGSLGDRNIPSAEADLTNVSSGRRGFGYLADPVCIASLAIYAANRFYLKPHHIGGLFTVGYLNDVMCLPLFVPMFLYAQHVIGLRRGRAYPRLWEILQHWVIFSILFEVILPRYPKIFVTTADPLDVVAYLVGGLAAWAWWSSQDARARHCKRRITTETRRARRGRK